MRTNRVGSLDRDNRIPPNGYNGPPSGIHGGQPRNPTYGSYPGPSQYARGGGQSGVPIPPPYGAPPDRRFRDEPPGPNPGDRYEGSPATLNVSTRGHFGGPPYEPPRTSPDAEGKEQLDNHANRGPRQAHGYTDGLPSHRYGPQPPGVMDHHGRRPSPSFQGSFPPPYDAEPRGRYGTYEGDSGVRDNAQGPPPSGRQALAPQSHASVIGDDFQSGQHYRYGDGPREPPRDDRADPLYDGIRRAERETTERSRRLSDIAPSPDGSQVPQSSSPSDITSSHRDEVVNMGCTCKKSKCLKLYCQCFAASVVCGPNCRCLVCHNTPRHPLLRKDAIRAILARNPQAFETKFKATDKVATTENGLVVAHKSGCKCRKSACLKKYCECYHGGVKCSANCRCINCRNMPPGGLGLTARPDHSLAARSFAADVYSMKNKYGSYGKEQDSGGAVDAAQNLTFLKNGSPQRPEARPARIQEYPPVPSLASSDTSPDLTEGVGASTEDKKPGGKVNALLMAAYAMTELTNPGSSPDKKANNLSAEKTPQEAAVPVNTPEKAILKNDYRSPKRKCDDDSYSTTSAISAVGSAGTSPENKAFSTAPDERQAKRGRFGSSDAAANVSTTIGSQPGRLGGTQSRNLPTSETKGGGDTAPNDKVNPTEAFTPESSLATSAATPVSARCLDFRHMDMNGKNQGRPEASIENGGDHI